MSELFKLKKDSVDVYVSASISIEVEVTFRDNLAVNIHYPRYGYEKSKHLHDMGLMIGTHIDLWTKATFSDYYEVAEANQQPIPKADKLLARTEVER